MLLSKQWIATVGVNVQFDFSYAMIPINGEELKLYRETRVETFLDKVNPIQLSYFCDVDLGTLGV
jgi:hypothetical protein